MKRRLDKALGNDFSKESSIDNINSAITLAKSMKVYDVVNPSGKIMGEVAEIVNRLQNAEELESVDMSNFGSNLDFLS
jgi:predicted membrane chloride channel (bestrophin family)